MQVRFSTALGLPVTDEEMTEQIGTLSGVLLHPDTGQVEGFFVRVPRFLHAEELFLSSFDILRWGLRVIVRDRDVLSPVEERIRLQSLLEDGRTILRQPIVTDTGRALGRCGDVQFDTVHFVVHWIWPKRWGRWGIPLPMSQVLEVRKDAIIVRDPAVAAPEKAAAVKAPLLNQMPETA